MNRTNLPPLTTAVPENFVLFGVPSTSSSEIQGGRRSLLFSFIATLVRTNPIVMVPRAIVQSESEGDMVARVLALLRLYCLELYCAKKLLLYLCQIFMLSSSGCLAEEIEDS